MGWSQKTWSRLRRLLGSVVKSTGAEAGPLGAQNQLSPAHTPRSHKLQASVPAGETAEARLARLANWCVQGQRAAAELELHEWQRHDDCPAIARVLMVSLLATRGDWTTARELLRRATQLHISNTEADDFLLQLRIAMDGALEVGQSSRRWVRLLHERFGHEDSIELWLKMFAANTQEFHTELSHAPTQQLSRELIAQPLVIPSIVHAQMIKPEPQTIEMLRRALTLSTRELLNTPHATATCQALAELALLAHDHDDARRWAHRGLKLSPLNATLALVLSRIEDDAHVGSPAVAVLERVHEAKPEYPDLHAALIRREFAQGDIEAARNRLNHWLDKEPQNPLAQRLRQELAA